MVESTKEFDYIKIKLASPFRILTMGKSKITKWSICWRSSKI
jgi:hypothetical protein